MPAYVDGVLPVAVGDQHLLDAVAEAVAGVGAAPLVGKDMLMHPIAAVEQHLQHIRHADAHRIVRSLRLDLGERDAGTVVLRPLHGADIRYALATAV